MRALIVALVVLIHQIINIYLFVVVVAVILSFFRPDPTNPIVQFIYQVTEPLFAWLRRKFPYLVVGNFDLSPLVVILGLQFIDTFLMNLV
jgi:YggT family protein